MAKVIKTTTLAEMIRKTPDAMLRQLEQSVAAEKGINVGQNSTREDVQKAVVQAISERKQKSAAKSAAKPATAAPTWQQGTDTRTTQQKYEDAQKALSDYTASDEYRIKQQERNREALRQAQARIFASGAAASDLPLNVASATPEADTKEHELKATVEHYKAQMDAEANQAVQDADLAEYETWSEEDRANLDRYIMERDQAFYNSLNPAISSSDTILTVQKENPLVQKYGQKRVNEMVETLTRQRNQQITEQMTEAAKESAGKSFWSGAGHSLLSIPANVLGGVTGLVGLGKEGQQRTGRYATLDANNEGNLLNAYAGAVRGEFAENIAGDEYSETGEQTKEGGTGRQLLSYGYQGIMSLADSISRGLIFGPAGGAALAASSSFTQTVSDASRRGATPQQAVALGVATAGMEYISEKIPVDKVFKLAKGGKTNVLMRAFKQAGIEITAEELNLFGSMAAEAAILQEKSSYKQQIGDLVANGASYEDAKEQANKAIWEEVKQTAWVSGISGGVSGAGASIVGNLNAPQIAPAEISQETTEAAPVAETAQPEPTSFLDDAAQQLAQEAPVAAPVELTPEQQMVEQAAAETMGVQPDVQSEDTTIINTDPAQHTPQEQMVIDEYQNAVDDNLVEYVEAVKNNPGQKMPRYPLKNVSDRAAQDIQRLTGIDVSGNKTHIEPRMVEHILKDHGENGATDRSMRDVNDIARIQYVIDNYDTIEHGGTSSAYVYQNKHGRNANAQTVVIKKKVNGTYFVVEAVPDTKKKTLYVVSAYMSKNGHKETASSLSGDAEAYRVTSDNATKSNAVLNYSIPQNGAEVNGNSVVVKGTGAAERNFTGKADYQELLHEGNVQPDRPGDVRPMEVPKEDGYGRRVTEFTANAYGAEVTPDRMANEIESLVQEGALGFDSRSNKESLEAARDSIYGKDGQKGKGEAATRTAITRNIANGKIQDGDIEKAMLLYAKYANRKSQTSQESAAELLVDLATMANMTGRNLQMFRMLRMMTPEGQLMAVQKNVARYVDNLNESRSTKKQAEAEIPQELEDAFLTAETDEERNDAADAIYKSAAAQIKPTLGEMWDAWRNLAMLGNIKTHVRNIGGSLAFRPYVSVKRAVGAAFERMFMDQQNRTKAVLGTAEESRALLSWAREDAKTDVARGAMEFSGTTGNESRNAIDDARRLLPGKLEDVRRKNMELMEGADMVFKQREYAYSLASFLKARGYSAADVQNGKVPDTVLQEGRTIAVKEAQKATFNDRNKFSDAISKFRFKGSGGWSKALNTMAKGIMPFTRTPANIVVRAKEYSPLELARGFTNLAKDVKAGKANVSESIDQIASGLTGTGAMLLGWALAEGIVPGVRLVGKIEDEDELREGAQEYSIQIGDTYYGISWLAPANIPLFIGANLYSSIKEKMGQGDMDGWDVISAIAETSSDALDPMLELSCLSSFTDAIENAAYEDSPGDMLLSVMATSATNYFTQGLPTVFGQAEQTTETTKSSVYSNADNPMQRAFERTVGNATKRILGIDLYQTEKLDEFGNVVENEGNLITRAVNAFLNPFTTTKVKDDAVTAEISRLHEVQPDKVTPPSTTKTISYTDSSGERHTDHRLTEEEYHKLATVQGQTAKTILEEILDSDTYKAMTDEQKASVFGYVYDYAREKGRAEALSGYEELSGWMSGIEGKEADTILNKAITGAFSDAFDLLEDDPETAARELEQAVGLLGDNGPRRLNYANEAGGRVKYYINALQSGVNTETFVGLYQQFKGIDQDTKLDTSAKASSWSYALEKAQEAGTITKRQKEKLKENMVYYQMFPADTAKFNQLTESGIAADDALDIGKLLEGITPQEGYTNVRDVQKAEAIAGMDLGTMDKAAAMKAYLSDSQDKNLDQMLSMGYSAEDYALVYSIYANESGNGKKSRTIQKIQNEFGISYGAAKAIYEVYG